MAEADKQPDTAGFLFENGAPARISALDNAVPFVIQREKESKVSIFNIDVATSRSR